MSCCTISASWNSIRDASGRRTPLRASNTATPTMPPVRPPRVTLVTSCLPWAMYCTFWLLPSKPETALPLIPCASSTWMTPAASLSFWANTASNDFTEGSTLENAVAESWDVQLPGPVVTTLMPGNSFRAWLNPAVRWTSAEEPFCPGTWITVPEPPMCLNRTWAVA